MAGQSHVTDNSRADDFIHGGLGPTTRCLLPPSPTLPRSPERRHGMASLAAQGAHRSAGLCAARLGVGKKAVTSRKCLAGDVDLVS
ncbi:MAG: hypothetical protein H0T78_09900 [Longispora sp.]|nr:hypothetical protein [Longispora sp. (in: high G+C Gram-positive bacteria)]